MTIARSEGSNSLTLLAFGGAVVISGGNFIAVKYTSGQLPPFFGAGFRFGMAGLLLLGIATFANVPKPSRDELVGTFLYGLLGFGGAMALGYWGLQELPAAVGSVIVATVPVITLFLARVQGLEPFRWRGLLGGLLTIAGIAFLVAGGGATAVPFGSALAMFGAAMCMAEAAIVVKKLPPCHPIAFNGLAMLVGSVVLMALSLSSAETWALPTGADVWLALAFMVLAGSMGLFGLYLFVLRGWSASTASYQFVLIPVVSALLAWWLLDEPLGGGFAIGASAVLLGVYVGALSSGRVPVPASREQEAYAQRCAST